MNYRSITPRGCRVSTVALGGNIFGYACNGVETREILHAAESFGVNFVDTADVYSDGRSEEMIGDSLEGRRDRWVIATKVGVKSGATGNGIGSRKIIFDRVEHSLRRLRTDRIDIYQLHHNDPATPIEETLSAFDELRIQGKILHFGISNCTAPQVDLYLAGSRKTRLPPPATHQLHYNLLKREIEHDLLPQAEQAGICLLAYGVLGRGVLTGKYRRNAPIPADTRASRSARVLSDLQPRVLNVVEGLERIAQPAGLSISELAILYVLRSRAVAATLIGVRTIDQLRDIVRATDKSLPPAILAEVETILSAAGAFTDVSLGQQVTTRVEPPQHQIGAASQ